MSVIPSKSGLAALPGAQHIAASSTPNGQRGERLIALAGIVLVALNLRAAVVSLPPIYDKIAAAFPVDVAARSLMGTLPLLCFAVFGLLARRMSTRFGLEKSLVIAMVMVAAGELARATLSHSILVFGSFSVICLGGMGMGNVLLPPAITHYFKDRVGAVSGLFQVLMVVSASLPSLLAVPLTANLGWRTSVGLWCVFGALAVLPWLRLTQAHDAKALPAVNRLCRRGAGPQHGP